MNDKSKINKLILKSAYAIIVVLIIVVIALLILKYEVEGEQNMPFNLSSVIIISNAEGYQKEENKKYMWNSQIYQINDIYLNIEKNKNYTDTEIIKNIKIDNIKVNEEPKVGKIEFYCINSEEIGYFTYDDKNRINNQIEYTGDVKSDLENLKISNQGGTIIIRAVNKTDKTYTSNDNEFEHNGKLLNKVNISYEEILTKVSFDLTISLESDISYKANIELELPVGDITKEGSSSLEITDMKDIVFKRQY